MADETKLREALLAGIAGDSAAHRRFLTDAAALLRAFFRNRLRGASEDAEDLVQETLVALHARRGSYDPAFPLLPWLYAIARYRLIDHFRRRKRRGETAMPEDFDFGEIDPEYEAADARHDVGVLLAQLPEKQRHAIRLVKLEDKSVREAAALTGLTESDIKISIHRGLKRLSLLMAGSGPA